MNVLVCAACGRRLSEPLRLLPEVPERPPRDGREGPDGLRHAPPTMPSGTYPDGPGCLICAGPRDTLVVNPEDTRGFLASHDALREFGCCGPPGTEGPDFACPGRRAEPATLFADCSGPYETRFLPDAVRLAGL